MLVGLHPARGPHLGDEIKIDLRINPLRLVHLAQRQNAARRKAHIRWREDSGHPAIRRTRRAPWRCANNRRMHRINLVLQGPRHGPGAHPPVAPFGFRVRWRQNDFRPRFGQRPRQQRKFNVIADQKADARDAHIKHRERLARSNVPRLALPRRRHDLVVMPTDSRGPKDMRHIHRAARPRAAGPSPQQS